MKTCQTDKTMPLITSVSPPGNQQPVQHQYIENIDSTTFHDAWMHSFIDTP